MKKLILFTIAILFACAISAQTAFAVPERTANEQYPRAAWIMHYNLNIAISYAKSVNKTVDEFGKYCGDLYKLTWPKDGGFKAFVEGNILNFTDFSEIVEIVNQSDKKVTLKVSNLYKSLKDQGSAFNVSYTDYIQFFQSSHQQIADYMGCTINFKVKDDGVEVMMTKK